MSIETLQEEIARLDDAGLRRVAAYALVLNQRREGLSVDDLTAALDDPDPHRWIPLDEVARRLGLEEDAPKE